MKTKFLLAFSTFICTALLCFGQRPTMELTFTAIDSASYVQLDSIKVMNRTQGGDTVLYWPDTVLELDYHVGITEVGNEKMGLQIFQNYPNPVKDQTTITLYLPEKGKVNLVITDILGRQVINTERVLDRGYHSFRFAPGSGEIFFFTAYWKATSNSIKILTAGSGSGLKSSLEYIGGKMAEPQFKTIEATQDFSFSPGDTLLYIGFADTLQSGMLDTPETIETYTFQFATNIPCPGTPIVTYEGQVYNTVQIFSQCWLKENLDVGTMINGSQSQQNNDTIEKYCYYNNEDSCAVYGGLYQWDEMMQYTKAQDVQGICPPGWYIPTDEEWKVLEGAVDSQYGIGDQTWFGYGYRGSDAGTNLKSTSGWYLSGNGTDLFGFSALPGGYRYYDGSFGFLDFTGYWWSATESSSTSVWYRNLYFNNDGVGRLDYDKNPGFSVRCVRDMKPTSDFIELTFTAIDSAAYVQMDSVKIMNLTQGGDTTLFWPDTILMLEYEITPNSQEYSKQINGIDFTPGDELLYIVYADTLESGMLGAPETSDTLTLQFATNIPCPGTLTVTYEGQVYNTIQIFSQCWLKENLNVGTMIPSSQEMTDNSIFEKYCYDNEPDSCTKYGGLYQWDEMMQYTTQQGVQGICPPGWHLPTDEEWKVLEGAVDSQYGIGDDTWEDWGYRGFDAGSNLKTTSGWLSNGNGTDLFGFSGLPDGYRGNNGYFSSIGYNGHWWTSMEHGTYYPWDRSLYYYSPEVYRSYNYEDYGFSVRCVRDY